MLIREGLVVFYGNEISLGAFYGAWLFWLGLGSLAALRLGDAGGSGACGGARHPPGPAPWSWRSRSWPCVRCGWPWTSPPSEFVPLGDLFLALGLVTLPTGCSWVWPFP